MTDYFAIACGIARESAKHYGPTGGIVMKVQPEPDAVDMPVDSSGWAELDEGCYCDNGHQQNDTVCMWCWERGRRHWNDPEGEQ